MKIAVIDDYQDAFRTLSHYPKLKDHQVTVFSDAVNDPAKVAERLNGFDAVILTQQRTFLPRKLVEQLKTIKVIAQTGAHVAHIDLAACTEKGIAVLAGGGSGGRPNPTAELTWGLILAAIRHIPFEVAQMKAGHWQSTLGTTLAGKTLGIYAFGKIGSIVATVGRAFGMKVVCFGREGSLKRAAEAGFEVAASREAFFAEADVLSLHIPLNGETRGIVKAADLARMKPSALIVNTSRAGLIEKGALEAALKNGRPGFGAIDVFEEEPVLGSSHPLLSMKNVVCTPHLGYVTRETYEAYYDGPVQNLLAFAAGKPQHVANPEVVGGKPGTASH